MKRILLVVQSKEYGQRIREELEHDYAVTLCHTAKEAKVHMAQRPDGMLIEMQLPDVDGLQLLESLFWTPPVILSLAVCYSPYEYQRLKELGVGHCMRTPCHFRAVANRLRDMMKVRDTDHHDPEQQATDHLLRLGISPNETGGRQLRIGIQLFAQDRNQKISKELYPAIAILCNTTPSGAEIQIRRTITDAWNQRDPECWSEYFPNLRRQPANKLFLSTLAEKLY